MFRKFLQVAAMAAAMAVAGSAMAAGGKRPNMTPREITGVVNINTATVKELELLPGVGNHTAGLIVAYREKTPFKAPADLLKVKGVGPGILRKVKQYVTISGPTTLSAASPAKAEAAVPARLEGTPAAKAK